MVVDNKFISVNKYSNKLSKVLLLIGFLIVLNLLNGCSMSKKEDGPPTFPKDLSKVKEAVPKVEPKSKYGNPSSYTVFGKKYYPIDSNKNFIETGIASWYGTKFHGRRTSSGEEYDMYAMTGAHKTLPLPTYAKVTNLDNNKSIIIKINDRGPFHDNRILDLSYAAAAKLGVLAKGTANIKLSAIDPKKHLNKKINEFKSNTNNLIKNKLNFVSLQIGAFSDRNNAEDLINALAKTIDHPIVMSREIAQAKSLDKAIKSELFKVHIGPFPESKLDIIKQKLAKFNIINPLTISENIKTNLTKKVQI